MSIILQRGVAIAVQALEWLGTQGTRAIASLVAFLRLASIRLMLRKLCQKRA
jgi:hypothetical protein